MAMMVAGNKEGNGVGGKGDGNSNKGVKQGTVMETKRAMATAARVVGNKEDNGKEEGNCDSSEGGGQ